MTESIEIQILSRIKKAGRGWLFFAEDFAKKVIDSVSLDEEKLRSYEMAEKLSARYFYSNICKLWPVLK